MQEMLMDKHSILLLPAFQIKIFGVAALIFLLAACAGMPQERTDENGEPATSEREEQHSAVDPMEADPEVMFHVMAAERLISIGEYHEALEQYLDASMIADDPALAGQVARLAAQLGDWSSALSGAERWLVLDPDNEDARHIRILAWINTGDIDAAVNGLVDVLDRHEDEGEAWRRAATLMGAAERNEAALEVMSRLIERTGHDAISPKIQHIQSVLFWQVGEADRALDSALAAAEQSGERQHRVWAAQLAADREQLELALELYRQARSEDPEDVPLALAEAEVLRQLDRPDEARGVLQAMPEDSEVLYTLGTQLVEAGEYEQAKDAWERLAGLDVEDNISHHAFLVAHLAEMLEHDVEALAWYERVESGPNQNRALLRRAIIEGRDGQLMKARNLLRSVRLAGEGAIIEQSWLVETELLREAGMAEEAVDVASEALRESPRDTRLLYARALSAVAADDLALAEQDFRRIIQIDGENAMALNALGYTLTDRTDRHQEAYRLIRRALEIEPDDPAILDSMGWVYFRLGEPEKALPYLQEALEGEDNPEIAAHVIEVLWHLERYEEAREVLDHALEHYPDDEYLSETLERLGLPE